MTSDDGITDYPGMTSDGRPGWAPILEKQVKANEMQNTYAFSTLDKGNQPKVRFIIHRGLTSASSTLLSTTDVRMPKAAQLASDPTFEIAWWIENTAVQFRIQGKAYVVPNHDQVSDELKKCVEKIAGKGDEANPEWWISERKRLWKDSMSGHLRASFARPTPGTPLKDVETKPKDWVDSIPAAGEDDKQKKEVENALSHFALLAIVPTSFEYLELKAAPNRRNVWTKSGDEWKVEQVVP